MYEFSLARSVNNTLLKLCQKSGWSRVRHIVLKIGGMRKVNPELITFIFNLISLGTPAEGANFSILFLPNRTESMKATQSISTTIEVAIATIAVGASPVGPRTAMQVAIAIPLFLYEAMRMSVTL